MTKFKHDIAKKNLSWEKRRPIICDHEKCNDIGEFNAPKSRSELNNYYYFCLKHVSEYNKSLETKNHEDIAVFAGEGIDMIHDIPPAKIVLERMINELQQIIVY